MTTKLDVVLAWTYIAVAFATVLVILARVPTYAPFVPVFVLALVGVASAFTALSPGIEARGFFLVLALAVFVIVLVVLGVI